MTVTIISKWTSLCFLLIVLLNSCEPTNSEQATDPEDSVSPDSVITNFSPVPFPDLDIPGFSFPEDSATINRWLAERDEDNIYRHAWGLWTGLTKIVSKTCNGDNLRVFETWDDPEYLADRMQGKPVPGSQTMGCGRPPLTKPTQFGHVLAKSGPTASVNDSIFEAVVYSPAAAKYAVANKIYSRAILDSLYAAGKKNLNFPIDAITAKPVFKIIPRAQIDQAPYPVEVWPGPVSPAAPMPEDGWNSFVYITNDAGQVSPGEAGNIYSLDDFIHFEFAENDIAYFQSGMFDGNMEIKAGDYAILVGMHVTSREITRWTWQTFYWTPAPDNPTLPSSPAIAALRPSQLEGAPAHYAVTASYNMVWPVQPDNGGKSVGEPVYAYNPYLEAPFSGSDIGPGAITLPNGKALVNTVGTQTNCMSCHIMAVYTPSGSTSPTRDAYQANTYVGMDDPYFMGQLKTDFAYSVGATLYPKKSDN